MLIVNKLVGLFAICLVLLSCGDDKNPPTTPPAEPSKAMRPPPVAPLKPAPANTIMPAGKTFDYGPDKGQPLYVVGVEHNDQLNIRNTPDANANILIQVPPLAPPLYSLGQGWQLPSGAIWWQVESNDGQNSNLGWANLKYLAALGASIDITEKLSEIKNTKIENLANVIASTLTNNKMANNIVVIEPAHGIDAQGGAMQFDLLGFADDSVRGERIRVVFDFVWDETGAVRRITDQAIIRTAFSTPICVRGVNDGICI